MVAFSARRLVWSAMVSISVTISPMAWAASDSWVTTVELCSVSVLASLDSSLVRVTCSETSRIEAASSSEAAATAWMPDAAAPEAVWASRDRPEASLDELCICEAEDDNCWEAAITELSKFGGAGLKAQHRLLDILLALQDAETPRWPGWRGSWSALLRASCKVASARPRSPNTSLREVS
jgi:hypothetical protein